MRRWGWTIAIVFLLVPGIAEAFPTYKSAVPNNGEFNCTLCHDAGTNQGPVANPFGIDARENIVAGKLDWLSLRLLDSDGDGATNGAELGDPCGSFDGGFGDAPRTNDISDPGDAGSECTDCGPVCECGDNIDDANEVCDGTDLAGNDCASLGYSTAAGAVCAIDCQAVDTSGCQATCGDGKVEPGEMCDDGNDDPTDACTNDCAPGPTSGGSNGGPGGSSGAGCAAGGGGGGALSVILLAVAFALRRRRSTGERR